jgi:hypothetical protein
LHLLRGLRERQRRRKVRYDWVLAVSADNDSFGAETIGQSVVFGRPLKDSLKHASVQISTANSNGELYVWGYIPVVVAKWYVLPPLPSVERPG